MGNKNDVFENTLIMDNVERKALSREDIFNTDDETVRAVEVPEWGGLVYVRSMTGRDRDRWESSIISGRGNNTQINFVNARAKLVALCTVDEKGERIFEDSDVKRLGDKSAKAIDRLFAVAQELSGISEKDVDEITKNFEGTLSEEAL